MNDIAYRAELERVTRSLIEMVGNQSLDPIIAQALKYAYSMGKTDGYAAGVAATAEALR